ncbi:MAG: sulfoxide reductase heme-binding subunit YedZ, partial [Lysobacterales bacterium]
MAKNQPSILSSKYLNDWYLFAVIVTPMCIAALMKMSTTDLSTPAGTGAMITFSVRLAVPWLFLAFAASSLFYVFRDPFSKWLLKNRRIIGLCFASGMAWQLFFIVILTTVHYDYYMANENGIHSLVERVPGYLFLFAMTITSFKFARRKLSSKHWRLLHK